MSIYSYKQRNTIVLVILITLGVCILYSLRIIAGSLLSTVVLYTIFRPVNIFLVNNWRWKKPLAAVAIILSSFGIIVFPFLALSLMVIEKVTELQDDPFRILVFTRKIDEFTGATFNQPHLLDRIIERAGVFAEELFPSLLEGAAGIALGVVVMYFLLYFMFTEQERFEKGLLKYAPFREQNALKFALELKNITYSNVLGQGFIAIVQGALVSLGFFMFGIRDAVFWGVIATFLSFLPIIGSPVVFVPAAIIEMANGNQTAGLALLLWGFILVMNIDNVIRFLIAKKMADTHPIITVIGVIIGIPIFGILGLVFGPLLLSYFMLTIRIYETSKMASERLERIRSGEEE